MKIEVSFDRTTRKQFRDQCVRRLQNFVKQIRSSDRNCRLDSPTEITDSGRQQNVGDLRLKFEDILDKKITQKEREVKRENKTLKKQILVEQLEQPMVLSKLATPKQSKRQCNKYDRDGQERQLSKSNFNLAEIKQNVNKIMQKLQTSSKKQSLQNQKLQNQILQTNQKLDQLITHLQQQNILKKPSQPQQSHTEPNNYLDSPQTFQLKFNDLANKYNRIKQSGVRSSDRLFRTSKSAFSMQSTNQSVTFRQN